MKIVHLVSYAVLSGPLPGVLLLARAQREAGHSAYVVHDGWRSNFSPYEEMACGSDELRALAAPWSFTLSPKGGIARALADMWLLRRLTHQGAIDVLHSHLSHDHALAAVGVCGRTALVRTLHAARATQTRWGARALLSRSHGLIARSPDVAAAAAQLLGATARLPVQTIAGSINSATWHRGPHAAHDRQLWRTRWGIPQQAPVMGQVALMAHRGQEELLAAFAAVLDEHRAQGVAQHRLPHLVLVGRGPCEVALRWSVGRGALARHVHWPGYVHAAALPSVYSALDGAFVAQPGNDGAARAALEAMAARVPLVAVSSSVLAAFAAHGAAYLAQNRSPEAIATALRAWLAGGSLWPEAAERAARWVTTERSPAQEAQATQKLYCRALRVRRRNHET